MNLAQTKNMLTRPAVCLRPEIRTDTDIIKGLPPCAKLFLLPVIPGTNKKQEDDQGGAKDDTGNI